jgi:uncharacterized membrane protein YfcA
VTIFIISLAGFCSWVVSTIGAGGGEFILIAALTYALGAQMVAPVATLSSLVAVPARTMLFREHIDWAIVRWFVSGAIPGALIGAWLFTQTKAEWMQIVIALFLLTAPVQYGFGKRERSFEMRLPWFMPAGFVVAFLSGLIGGMGPVLNPLYLNYGTAKEAMIGTKSFNSFVMHVVAIGTYTSLGAMKLEQLGHGVAAGLAGIAGSWLGKRWLRGVSEHRFRQTVVWLMVVSAVVMLWQQRALLDPAHYR